MIKRPILFSSFALLVGVVLGFSLLYLENYAAKKLIGLLEHEVVSAGPYKLEYDSADMSFITFKGQARNARITENGETKVLVPLLQARFSFWKIAQKIATLEELKLVNATIHGVTKDSPIFKVINYILTPLPPESASPLKIDVRKLILTPSLALDDFGDTTLRADKLQILLKKNFKEDFDLTATTGKLTLISKKTGNPILPLASLDNFKTNLIFTDDYVEVNSLSAEFEGGKSSGLLHINNKDGEHINGKLRLTASDKSLNTFPEVTGSINVATDFHGSLADPKASSIVKGNEITLLPFIFSDQLKISNLIASIEAKTSNLGIEGILKDLVGQGQNLTISLVDPLYFGNQGISGTLNLSANSLDTPYGILNNLNLKIEVDDLNEIKFIFNANTPDSFPVDKLISTCSLSSNLLSCSLNSEDGEFDGNLKLQFRQGSSPFLESASVNYSNIISSAVSSDINPLRYEVSGLVSGPLSLELLEGEAQVKVRNIAVLNDLDSNIKLQKGMLSVTSSNSTKTLEIEAQSNLVGGSKTEITINANDHRLSDTETKDCSNTSFTADLSFPAFDYTKVDGNIMLQNLNLGCLPYGLAIDKPTKLEVEKGFLSLSNFLLSSAAGDLKVDGNVSLSKGYDLKALGQANLSALLPFTPTLNELSGDLILNLDMVGPLDEPKLSGRSELANTIIELESPDLRVSNGKGQAILDGRIIEIKTFDAELNGGSFIVDGKINLDSISASEIRLDFNKILIAPSSDTEFISSGQLTLSHLGDLQPTVAGKIIIESAQIEKRFDMIKLATEISQNLIGMSAKKIEIETNYKDSPVNLDLSISAPSSLYFNSNFAQAEAKTDLQISGPAYNPKLSGQVEILEGWFGLRDRRFDIGSGKIIISNDNNEPEIEILAETSVFSRQGETVVVFATITGPVSSAEIKLDSDRGYSDREIIQLLTTATDITNTNSRVGMFSQDFDFEVPFVSDDSFFGLGRWLRRLTKIDSLSIEPSFNSQRGVIEPTLIAEKSIWPNLVLRGETSFGGSGYDAKARLNYALFPRVTLSGIIDALASEENTALGVDLSYEIKPLRSSSLRIELSGNTFLPSDNILDFLNINEDSRVTREILDRLRNSLLSYYFDFGFPLASAEINCGKSIEYGRCKSIRIIISEGPRFELGSIETEGDALPQQILEWLKSQESDSTATREYRETITNSLIARLRNEGYIRARVSSAYKFDKNPTGLILTAKLGKPVSFIFSGNKSISNEKLLSTINIFGRQQPFGNNTINLLTTNIERLYDQSGFPYAVISWKVRTSEDIDRTVYQIDITEGEKLDLRDVKFEGISDQILNELKAQIQNDVALSLPSIVRPPLLVADGIEENCRVIQATLVYLGFDDAKVSYRLSDDLNNKQTDLIYQIVPGNRNIIDGINISGLPPEFESPHPLKPFSKKKMASIKSSIEHSLSSLGYRDHEVTEISDPDKNIVLLQVSPGLVSRFGVIEITGLEEITIEVVLDKLEIEKHNPWDENLIAKSRQALMRTGLFKKVEIKPKDGILDSLVEDAIVIVEERNLQSIQIGTGLNSEHGLHVFGLLTDRSYFADGRSISARVDAYFDQFDGDVSKGVMSINYADPEIIEDNIGFLSDLRFQRLDLTSQEFDLDRVSHAAYLHKIFDENLSGAMGHTFLVENLDNVDSGAVLNEEYDTGTVNIGYVQGNLLLDYRDNPLNPRRGHALSLSPQIADKALGSEANFAGLDMRASKILPFLGKFERFSLAFSARASSAWTYNGSNFVPITQRYYSGGRTSVRGYRENSLGPKSESGAVIGGDQLLTQSVELRYLLTDEFYLDLFLDSGKLSLRDYNADGEEMRYSSGFGARYLSPIGPIGFDVGFPLNEKSGEPSTRLHFEIGASF